MPKRIAPEAYGRAALLRRGAGGPAHERRVAAARADGGDAPGLAAADLHVGEARDEGAGDRRPHAARRDRLGLLHRDPYALVAVERSAADRHRSRVGDLELRPSGRSSRGSGDDEGGGDVRADTAHLPNYLPAGL